MSDKNKRSKTLLIMACVLGVAAFVFLPKATSRKSDPATDKQIVKAQSSTGKITDSGETSETASTSVKKDEPVSTVSKKEETATTSPKKDDSEHQNLKPEIDPDDYDLEGYYEDNRDEYDDIDDAYDGFMDDEDAWEDY